jgi:SAM-dependent methyltransferase
MPSVTSEMTGQCPRCGSSSSRIICRRQRIGREWGLALCQKCHQHYTTPTPSEDEICAFYAGTYHSDLRTAAGTAAAFESKYHRYVETLGRHLRSGRVVDVGCSTGLLVSMLRARGYDAEGIELNSESAEWGRQHYDVVIHSTPLECSSYGPESLDALLFTDVLEHTQHPRDYLRDAGRSLVRGGLAFVTFPDICSLDSRYNYLLSRLLRRDWLWGNCHIPLHVWEFTPATAESCFTEAGFEVVEFRRSQPPPEPIDSFVEKILALPIRCLTLPILSNWLGTQMEFVIRKSNAS